MDEDVVRKILKTMETRLEHMRRELAAGSTPEDLWRLKCTLDGATSMASLAETLLIKASRE